MKIFGSRIASFIDNEFRAKERVFRRNYCDHCANAETSLCEIRNTIDHQLKCVYFKKKEDK